MLPMKAGRQRLLHAYVLPALACEALTGSLGVHAYKCRRIKRLNYIFIFRFTHLRCRFTQLFGRNNDQSSRPTKAHERL